MDLLFASSELTAPTETTAAEEAGDFFRRLVEYRLLEQHGREYEALHPAHQALIERTDFEACWRAVGSGFPQGTTLESFRVIDEYDEPYANVGIEEQLSKAVTWEATLGYEGSFKERQTNHALLVDGEWRWVVSRDFAQAFKRGECPGTDLRFDSTVAAKYPKGYPKKVPLSSVPDFMRYELGEEQGATHAVAVAPGVWTILSPGTSVSENADSGSLTGYCASVEKFERQFGEDCPGSCW